METKNTMCAGKRYFAAGNTGVGFYNCFDYINDARREGFMYILKGGPGTGKSTLMKNTGRYFEASGEAAEYFHCSSDENSLDGLRLIDRNIAIVDGTAPHVTEAQMPGITAAIINLGDYIGQGIKRHGEEIAELAHRKKECFDTAYAYIRAAAELDAVNTRLLLAATEPAAVKAALKSLWETLKIKRRNSFSGRERRLFISAVSGAGKTDLIAANKYRRIISLDGNPCAARSLLAGIAARLAFEGCEHISFCDILNPKEREALQVDNVLIAIDAPKAGLTVNLKDSLIQGTYAICRDRLLYGYDAARKILGLAAESLSEARAAHNEIEARYIPVMDFNGLDLAAAGLRENILKG